MTIPKATGLASVAKERLDPGSAHCYFNNHYAMLALNCIGNPRLATVSFSDCKSGGKAIIN